MSTVAPAMELRGSSNHRIMPAPPFSGNYLAHRFDSNTATSHVRLKENSPRSITREVLGEFIALISGDTCRIPVVSKSVILESAIPKTFSLGGDLEFFLECIKKNARRDLIVYAFDAVKAIYVLSRGMYKSGMTSVALVQGETQGGGFELALANHLIIAERGVRFGFPESLFGAYPGMGALTLLGKRIGLPHANEIVASARQWTSEELFDLGVVDALAAPGNGGAIANRYLSSISEAERERLGARFEDLSIVELRRDVGEWVDRMLSIQPRNIRTIEYLLRAQQRSIHPTSD